VIIRCAWCKKILGEKPPYDDKSYTDTICPECEAKFFPEDKPKKNPMTITQGDQEFIKKVLMPHFHVRAVRLSWNNSTKKWPDLWCEMGNPFHITVTREWAEQTEDERRKRLTHEFLHSTGLQHGFVDGLEYSTQPIRDEYSKEYYWALVNKLAPKKIYGERDIKGFHNSQNFAHVSNPEGKILVPVKKIEKKEIEKQRDYPERPLATPRRWQVNPKVLYQQYVDKLLKQWNWDEIAQILNQREQLQPTDMKGKKKRVFYYLGDYLKMGPDVDKVDWEGKIEGQHYYDQIWFHPGIGGIHAGSYRLGQWFDALQDVSELFNLHPVLGTKVGRPTDIYVTSGVRKDPDKKGFYDYDDLEGWHEDFPKL
jgi:phage FluMu protein Com